MDFGLRQSSDADHFVARTVASDDGQTGRGKIKQLGEKFETGGVRFPFHRRRRQPDLERLTDQARHLVAGGPGLDTDGQSGLRLSGRLTGHRRYS